MEQKLVLAGAVVQDTFGDYLPQSYRWLHVSKRVDCTLSSIKCYVVLYRYFHQVQDDDDDAESRGIHNRQERAAAFGHSSAMTSMHGKLTALQYPDDDDGGGGGGNFGRGVIQAVRRPLRRIHRSHQRWKRLRARKRGRGRGRTAWAPHKSLDEALPLGSTTSTQALILRGYRGSFFVEHLERPHSEHRGRKGWLLTYVGINIHIERGVWKSECEDIEAIREAYSALARALTLYGARKSWVRR